MHSTLCHTGSTVTYTHSTHDVRAYVHITYLDTPMFHACMHIHVTLLWICVRCSLAALWITLYAECPIESYNWLCNITRAFVYLPPRFYAAHKGFDACCTGQEANCSPPNIYTSQLIILSVRTCAGCYFRSILATMQCKGLVDAHGMLFSLLIIITHNFLALKRNTGCE